MTNYHAQWANSALRPTLFGVIDAYAGIPLIMLAFDLDNSILAKTSLLCILVLVVLDYFGYTPQACYLSVRRQYGSMIRGGRRSSDKPFGLFLRRLLTHR